MSSDRLSHNELCRSQWRYDECECRRSMPCEDCDDRRYTQCRCECQRQVEVHENSAVTHVEDTNCSTSRFSMNVNIVSGRSAVAIAYRSTGSSTEANSTQMTFPHTSSAQISPRRTLYPPHQSGVAIRGPGGVLFSALMSVVFFMLAIGTLVINDDETIKDSPLGLFLLLTILACIATACFIFANYSSRRMSRLPMETGYYNDEGGEFIWADPSPSNNL